jgi:hypothetical protein
VVGPDRHVLPYFMTSRRDEIYVIGHSQPLSCGMQRSRRGVPLLRGNPASARHEGVAYIDREQLDARAD